MRLEANAKILIVEDNRQLAGDMKSYLEDKGFLAECCYNGEEALAVASNGWDLILLDIIMPEKDGLAVCEELREKNINVPILFLTAFANKEVVEAAIKLGALEYILKPFDIELLEGRIRGHIYRHRFQSENNRASFEVSKSSSGLEIDTATCTVKRDNVTIDLKAKEFKLLEFLSSHPDMVFSSEDLYTRVWGELALGNVNTVAVHIRRLREKIETDPKKPRYIQNKRGLGYYFAKES